MHAVVRELIAEFPKFQFNRYRGGASAYVVETLQTVFHYFFGTAHFEECLVGVVNQGGDADTTGAIAGMIAGAFYGLDQKGIKQRQESAEAFRKAGREESAAKEEREAEILEEYLPAQVSEDELRQAIEALAEEKDLAGMKDLGQVMGPMMQRFAGKADGSTVQKLAREVLAARDEG